jgi:hypothetical protein
MTVESRTSATSDARSTPLPVPFTRTPLTTLVVSLGLNLLIWAGAQLAGADFEVSRPGAQPMTVGPVTIALMTAAPVLLGSVVLAVATRRSPRAQPVLGWLGLVIGILTAPMPFTVQAGTGTQVTLAAMHLVSGAVWWLTLRRSSR